MCHPHLILCNSNDPIAPERSGLFISSEISNFRSVCFDPLFHMKSQIFDPSVRCQNSIDLNSHFPLPSVVIMPSSSSHPDPSPTHSDPSTSINEDPATFSSLPTPDRVEAAKKAKKREAEDCVFTDIPKKQRTEDCGQRCTECGNHFSDTRLIEKHGNTTKSELLRGFSLYSLCHCCTESRYGR